MQKLKRWILLSMAGALALLAGNRLNEATVLDPDNMGHR